MHMTRESRFVINPVCEQVVDAAHTAHTRTYRGEPLHFCCSQCLSA
jgi:YHS domain-containing protein